MSVGLDPRALQRDERGRAAIEEDAALLAHEEEAGVEAAAAAEGVAAADEGELHAPQSAFST